MGTEKAVIIKDPQGRQKGEIQFSDQEEARDLKRNSQGQIGSIEDLKGNKLAEADENSKVSWSNIVDAGKEVGRAVRDALTAHGDQLSDIKLRDKTTNGFTIRVYYKPSENGTGELEGDDWKFEFGNGKLYLKPSSGNPVEICDIQQQSGTIEINKDVAQDALQKFIKSNDTVQECGEEDLWECDADRDCFLGAVASFRNNGKTKESVKQLLKSARAFKKGNTIQEKLKEAAGWYNIYTQNPPKNTKEQVFLEESENIDLFQDVMKPISLGFAKLKKYLNTNLKEDKLRAYYRSAFEAFYKLYQQWKRVYGKEEVPEISENLETGYDGVYSLIDIVQKLSDCQRHLESLAHDEVATDRVEEWARQLDQISNEIAGYYQDNAEPESLDEIEEDLGEERYVDAGAGSHSQGEYLDDPDEEEYDYPEDDPKARYKIGDNTYRFVEWFGYKALLQNIDDDRDFELMSPEELKNLQQK